MFLLGLILQCAETQRLCFSGLAELLKGQHPKGAIAATVVFSPLCLTLWAGRQLRHWLPGEQVVDKQVF